MTVQIFVFGLAFLTISGGSGTPGAPHDTDDTARACYAQVGPVLRAAGGSLNADVRAAYLGWAEADVLDQLRAHGKDIVPECLAEVRANDELRDALYGSVFPPDPSILQNYAHMRADFGPAFMKSYRSLVIAEAVSKRTKGVQDLAPGNPQFGRDYQPDFWVDETLQHPGSDGEKALVRALADYMKLRNIPAADLYKNPTFQGWLKAYLPEHGIPQNLVTAVKQTTQFGEWLKNAMILLGQRPAGRNPKPPAEEWMRYLASINETAPSSLPTGTTWPLFPLKDAPWPMLMPLAHPVPIGEARYIWDRLEGHYGDDRFHTYGPYRDDDGAMPDELIPSQWFWDAWPDRIIHGGECVPLSKGTVDFYSALGKPAMWAGQPGHANLISFGLTDGCWSATIEQAFAGGPDVTCAQWYFDEEPGTELRYRDLYYWPGAEYQLGQALAMNLGLGSYMDTRIAANLYRCLPASDRQTLGANLLTNALQSNPYNPELWYRLASATTDPADDLKLTQAAIDRDPGVLTGQTSKPILQKFLAKVHGGQTADALNQYWQTVAEFSAQYAILDHNAPVREADLQRAYAFLRTVPGIGADDLASYTDKAAGTCPKEHLFDDMNADQMLAARGDAYGELRMGERYWLGYGVSRNEIKARSFLAAAAAQGEPAAAVQLGRLNASFRSDWIAVTASSAAPDQGPQHLIDGSGMTGDVHDNNNAAFTMWHTVGRNALSTPAAGLPASPAWVRFDFALPLRIDSIQIWNHNQLNLTDRGFRKARIYGTLDGATWTKLAPGNTVELPRAAGTPNELPTAIRNLESGRLLKSVIIAADTVDGNYGGACYGLSAVRFVFQPLDPVIPASEISLSASSFAGPDQVPDHLVDGAGLYGWYHENNGSAQTMWHTKGLGDASRPAPSLDPSPAWVRFTFTKPHMIDLILIWNHNQANLTDRGFRKTRIFGTSDGVTWFPLTESDVVEFPRADGSPSVAPVEVRCTVADRPIREVVVAAEPTDGNYGGNCYGLSAVRFVVHY